MQHLAAAAGPSAPPLRTGDDVAAQVAAALELGPPGRTDAELEWFVHDALDPLAPPPLDRVRTALAGAALPAAGRLRWAPGGQLGLRSVRQAGPVATVAALREDLTAVQGALAAAGLVLRGGGADPVRRPVRLLRTPYEDSLASYFALDGPAAARAARTLLCSTAAVRVGVDAGLPGEGATSAAGRWERAHALGPALVAAFACSPVLLATRTGWRSCRREAWDCLEPARTRPPRPGLGPVEATTEQALAARVLALRAPDGTCRPAPPLTLADWLAGALDAPPTPADVERHLGTLFPPVGVRRGYQLRYLDGLPDPLWEVAVAVATVLLDDERAADEARAACEPVEGRWSAAARVAVRDPGLARAALGCLQAAEAALSRAGADELAAAVGAYAERFPARSRCPADDVLDGLVDLPV